MCIREQPFDFYGGGDLSEPENFFLPIFRAGEFISPALRAGLFFFIPPSALFIKPWGGGGGGNNHVPH